MESLKDRCAIVGIGETEYSRNSGRSELQMAVEAAQKAVEDAGLRMSDIDGIVKFTVDSAGSETLLATALGIPNLNYWGEFGGGGPASCGIIVHAVCALLAGRAKHVLCYRTMNGYSEARFGKGAAGKVGMGVALEDPAYDEFQAPFGMISPPQWYGLVARRHMAEYGTTSEQLGAIAVAFRQHAQRNPRAQMYGRPMTLRDYLAARVIADPLRMPDCALESDGACAVVVTTAERARDLRQRPAYIMAAAQATGPRPQAGMPSWVYRPVITECAGRWVAPQLYEMAGVTPADIKVAEFYDCFTITVLIQLEDYGFCAKGEGGPFAASVGLTVGSRLAVNTHGGHLSEAYIHGLTHVLEGARQIRGTSVNQVEDAGLCLVTGGTLNGTAGVILRR